MMCSGWSTESHLDLSFFFFFWIMYENKKTCRSFSVLCPPLSAVILYPPVLFYSVDNGVGAFVTLNASVTVCRGGLLDLDMLV